jgi:hypothetical protein
MTDFADKGSIGTPGRAMRRIKDLLRDVREYEVEANGWLVRQPMDDHWQRWVKVDAEWAALTDWRAREKLKKNDGL